ncbi:MAG: hypothetical protein D6800_04760, partial [Candidatus Zixiibacteriota bacterium]
GNSRLVFYDQYANHQRNIESEEFDYPMAAAVDKQNRIWVLDGGTGRVMYLSPEGMVLYAVGPMLPGNTKALHDPSDLAVLPNGRLAIADTGNNRLLIARVVPMQQ